jgi:hypothetical protein
MSDTIHHCASDCAAPPAYPILLSNAPGLERIRYRIGDYASIRESLLYGIDHAPALQKWTHRLPDDPAIALLEGAAIVGDILTFYQEHYANETKLRTSSWRESITELVRLLGYRLSPALAGRAAFAIEIKGTRSIQIPAYFPLKADLVTQQSPADFETSAAITAHPHFSRFHLYPPRVYAEAISKGSSSFEIALAGGKDSPEALAAVNLKKGEMLMLVPSDHQSIGQTVKVTAVTPLLDRIIFEIEGSLAADWKGTVKAWRLGRVFKHHGHQAPPTIVNTWTDNNDAIHVENQQRWFWVPIKPGSFSKSLWLDAEAKDLSVGRDLIVEAPVGYVRFPSWQHLGEGEFQTLAHHFIAARTITGLESGATSFEDYKANALNVTLDQELPLSGKFGALDTVVDIRELRFHETTSPALTLRPVATFSPAFPRVTKLEFHGTAAQANDLKQRRLLFTKTGVETLERSVVDVQPVNGNPRRWSLTLSEALVKLNPADFDEAKPLVTAFGNVVDATQGFTEPETALGNGDASTPYQTFKLPKPPLTYLLSAGETPAEVPQLEIFVAKRRWQRVDTFFGQANDAQVYVVRDDGAGETYVQFGDGINGARLTSGLQNVTAIWRRGVGAHGPLKPDATPKGGTRLDGLDKVQMPGLVTGGSEREHAEKARIAAPGRVQSLGRIVSLRDYETELLSIPGISACTAEWDAPNGVPAVVLRVLVGLGREKEAEAIRDAVLQFQHQRGADRHPIVVILCTFKSVHLRLTVAQDASYRREDVEAAIKTALGPLDVIDDGRFKGLFSLRARRIGQREYASTIEGIAQNIPGVLWCRYEEGDLKCPNNKMLRLAEIELIFAEPGTYKSS